MKHAMRILGTTGFALTIASASGYVFGAIADVKLCKVNGAGGDPVSDVEMTTYSGLDCVIGSVDGSPNPSLTLADVCTVFHEQVNSPSDLKMSFKEGAGSPIGYVCTRTTGDSGGGTAADCGTVEESSVPGCYNYKGFNGNNGTIIFTFENSFVPTSTTSTEPTTTTMKMQATPIPVLGAFGIPLLGGLLALLGFAGLRRRK
jgi:hypothetical protein